MTYTIKTSQGAIQLAPTPTLPAFSIHGHRASSYTGSRDTSAGNSLNNSREGTPGSLGDKNRNATSLTDAEQAIVDTYNIDTTLLRNSGLKPTLMVCYRRWKEGTRVLEEAGDDGQKKTITDLFVAKT